LCRRGFTLIEVMVVVVVIGILATMVLPRLTRKSPSAKWENVLDDLNNLVYFARQESISDHKTYRLHFIVDKDGIATVQIEIEDVDPEKPGATVFPRIKPMFFKPTYTFPKEIELKAVYHNREEELEANKNNAYCYIIGNGLVQQTILHLIKTERDKVDRVSFKMEPFLGKFELVQGLIAPPR